MNTLGLKEAAHFLKMNPEELRKKAKVGLIPGAKAAKRWVFIEDDLVAYLRSLYASNRQALVDDRSKQLCRSTNAETCGGFVSPHQAASLLDSLLKQKTSRPLKNSTTS
ncbi:MAG: helix-turn-helix domain-containing protein [Terriglobia bacterium]